MVGKTFVEDPFGHVDAGAKECRASAASARRRLPIAAASAASHSYSWIAATRPPAGRGTVPIASGLGPLRPTRQDTSTAASAGRSVWALPLRMLTINRRCSSHAIAQMVSTASSPCPSPPRLLDGSGTAARHASS